MSALPLSVPSPASSALLLRFDSSVPTVGARIQQVLELASAARRPLEASSTLTAADLDQAIEKLEDAINEAHQLSTWHYLDDDGVRDWLALPPAVDARIRRVDYLLHIVLQALMADVGLDPQVRVVGGEDLDEARIARPFGVVDYAGVGALLDEALAELQQVALAGPDVLTVLAPTDDDVAGAEDAARKNQRDDDAVDGVA